MTPSRLGYPNLGLGVGLRSVHFSHILQNHPAVDWFEVISENFIDSCGRPRYVLEQIAERYPVVMHGVSLSIGSTDPLNFDYLAKLKRLAGEVNARWISDHLCWTGVAGHEHPRFTPLAVQRRNAAARHRSGPHRARFSANGRSSWKIPAATSLSPPPPCPNGNFLSRVADETDCGLLLDVNNVYVSSVNHDFDPVEYICNLPHHRIVQMHLAGHTPCRAHLLDTHDNHVTDPVWELYRLAHQKTGGVSSLLEWDAKIPPFPVVHAEVLKARQYMATQLAPLKLKQIRNHSPLKIKTPPRRRIRPH